MTVPTLSRTDARRLAVRAQLLDAHRPTGVFEVVRQLTLVQNDPTAAVAPSADLVLWSRLGFSYSPGQLRDALDEQTLLELHGFIRPPEDLALYRAEMADWPGRPPLREWQEDLQDWVAANNGCRLDILARLRADGPLTARELPDTCVVPWRWAVALDRQTTWAAAPGGAPQPMWLWRNARGLLGSSTGRA